MMPGAQGAKAPACSVEQPECFLLRSEELGIVPMEVMEDWPRASAFRRNRAG
jgi:hypothetical protein